MFKCKHNNHSEQDLQLFPCEREYLSLSRSWQDRQLWRYMTSSTAGTIDVDDDLIVAYPTAWTLDDDDHIMAYPMAWTLDVDDDCQRIPIVIGWLSTCLLR